MAEPVIVPPVPVVTQPSSHGAVDNSPGIEVVQRAFDKAYPDIARKPAATTETSAPVVPPPSQPATTTPPETKPPAEPEQHKLPAFIEDAFKLGEQQAPAPQQPEPDAEFADDLPQEQKQSRIKGLRDAYKVAQRGS